MNILHLSTHDRSGGAARAAYRLHTGLLRLGHESWMLVDRRTSVDPRVIAFQRPMDLMSRARRRLRREQIQRDMAPYLKTRPRDHEQFSDNRSDLRRSLVDRLPASDVINLHWVAGFVDYRAFFATVPSHTPVVWTLHDMNPFTGGCHYDRGCGKFVDRCGACPQLGSRDDHDLSRQVWQRKHAVFEQVDPARLHLVAPSRWLADEVRRSSLLGRFPVSVIPNSVDTDEFSPHNPAALRSVLDIPPSAKVLLFVSDVIRESRKGLSLLVEALRGLDDPDLFLLSIGSPDPALDGPIPHIYLGHVDHPRLLAMIYSAADVFVLPSLQDNLPNTALESLACGTPIVGFDVGGIPDMVRPGQTGQLVSRGDVAGLRDAIRRLLNDPMHEQMAQTCRRVAVEEYALEVQARRYADLYARLV